MCLVTLLSCGDKTSTAFGERRLIPRSTTPKKTQGGESSVWPITGYKSEGSPVQHLAQPQESPYVGRRVRKDPPTLRLPTGYPKGDRVSLPAVGLCCCQCALRLRPSCSLIARPGNHESSHSLALIAVGTEAKPSASLKTMTNLEAFCFGQALCH